MAGRILISCGYGFFVIESVHEPVKWVHSKALLCHSMATPTNLYTRSGHRLELRGLLPQEVGQVRDLGVIMGRRDPVAVRLILVRVPEEVARERQERLRQNVRDKQGKEPSDEMLYLAQWLILLTNLPRRRAESF
jgi:hypothetical protein